MTAPTITDTQDLGNVGPGSTSLGIDLSTLTVPSRRSKIIVLLFVRTTSSISGTLSTNDTRLDQRGGVGPGGTNGQVFWYEYQGDPTGAGSSTFSWSGAAGTNAGAAVAVGFVADAGSSTVHGGFHASGSVGFDNFDAASIDLPGSNSYDACFVLCVGGYLGTSVTNTTAPSGWADQVFDNVAGSAYWAIAAIADSRTGVTALDPGDWSFNSDAPGTAIPIGFSVYSSGVEPANNQFDDAETLVGCEDSVDGTTKGANLENPEYDDNWYFVGFTVWYKFTGKSGGWNFAIDSPASTDVEFEMFSGDPGDDLTTVLGNYVPQDDINFGTNHFDMTFNALDAGTTYWIQVDTALSDPADFTLSWTATDGQCVEATANIGFWS